MKRILIVLLAAVTLAGSASAQALGRLEELARQRLQERQGSDVRVSEERDVRVTAPRSRGSRALTPEMVGALDRVIDRETYKLGPGDGLLFSLWGEVDDSYDIVVTPEGRVLVPSVGPFPVAGVTLAEAEQQIIDGAGDAYSGSRMTLDIIKLRTFRVHVTGNVEEPGAYPATAADRVSDVIARAGGMTARASFRNILLTRRDGSEEPVDLVRYTLAGDLGMNYPVDLGDVVNVPAQEDSIGVIGAVANPGFVEYRPGDTARELIELAGGLQRSALLKRAEWVSFPDAGSEPESRTLDLSGIMDGSAAAPRLSPGDLLVIPGAPRIRGTASIRAKCVSRGDTPLCRGGRAYRSWWSARAVFSGSPGR